MLHRFAVLAIVAGLLAAPAAKAQDDPADLALWQTVQARNTPADYMVYLDIFPNGKFAPLARIRAQAAGPGTAPQPEPLPPAQADPDAPQFSVTPTAARVGQRFTVNCGTIPTGGGGADAIIVVPAGSPPTTQPKGGQGVAMDYVANCQRGGDGTFQLGPLPPGLWEFRWMSTLYNLENRLEVKGTVQVTVR